jgi:hypothetical protein
MRAVLYIGQVQVRIWLGRMELSHLLMPTSLSASSRSLRLSVFIAFSLMFLIVISLP